MPLSALRNPTVETRGTLTPDRLSAGPVTVKWSRLEAWFGMAAFSPSPAMRVLPFGLALALGVSACVSAVRGEQATLERMAVFAALAAADDRARLQASARPFQAAIREAGAYGYSPDGGDSITIHNPSLSGPYAGDPNALEVVVERPSSANPRGYLAASAIATLDPEGTPCLLSLPDGSEALTDIGRDLLKTKGCSAP